jgi:hypothetical protein
MKEKSGGFFEGPLFFVSRWTRGCKREARRGWAIKPRSCKVDKGKRGVREKERKRKRKRWGLF